MKKAIWFSRHPLSISQREEISSMGFSVEERIDLGSINISDEDDAQEVYAKLAKESPTAIFGVFAAPIAGEFFARKSKIKLFAAWNIMRSIDGGKPSFAHKKFVQIG